MCLDINRVTTNMKTGYIDRRYMYTGPKSKFLQNKDLEIFPMNCRLFFNKILK